MAEYSSSDLPVHRRTGFLPESGTALAAAALTVLITVFGLQLTRLFIPTLLFYLGHSVGLNIIPLGLVGAAVFLSSFLVTPLQRLFGLQRGLALVAGGTILCRASEQLIVSAPLDFGLSIVGTILFLPYLPLKLTIARARGSAAVSCFALAFLMGIAADSAIRIVAGTYDLTWQTGLIPTLIVLVLSATALVVLRIVLPSLSLHPGGVSWRRAWPLLAVGPWLALQLIVFQNPARAAALTGWSLPAAGFLITAGNILGLVAARWLAGRWSRSAAAAAGAVLVLLLLPAQPGANLVSNLAASLPPFSVAFIILVGEILSAILLMRAFSTSVAADTAPRGLTSSTIPYGLGYLLFTLLFFGYNAPYNLAISFSAPTILPVMAVFVALPAALAPASEPGHRPNERHLAFVLALVALLVAPASLALTWHSSQAAPPSSDGTLRILTYNLHNGFNVDGRLDMEALATVIEAADPDIVTLQEVSRGWVIAASLDMLSWLSHRLEMPYVASGPTTDDGQWGNAILSRYPIVSVEAAFLPPAGLPLKRGYLQADIDTGQATIHTISTHLHHIVEEGEIRQVQVEALLAVWDGAPLTLIGGDLNAEPHSPEMEMLSAAGLIDPIGLLAPDPVYTSPAAAPSKRIDYIWLSPDLVPESFAVTQTTASDHFPLLTVVRLPGD